MKGVHFPVKTSLELFFEELNRNPELQAKAGELLKTLPENVTEEEAFETVLVPIAREAGFQIRHGDLSSPVLDHTQYSDDELAMAAGGAIIGGEAYGADACYYVGLGVAASRKPGKRSFCVLLGWAVGIDACWGSGVGI